MPDNNSKKRTASRQTERGELVVMFKPDAEIKASKKKEVTSAKKKVSSLNNLFKQHDSNVISIFDRKKRIEKMPRNILASLKRSAIEPSSFFSVSSKADLEKLRTDLLKDETVEAAYIKPPAEEPDNPADWQTPDLTPKQGYLDSAPGGVDARFAWNMVGGKGNGIEVIDMERGFNLTHEDIRENFGGLISGNNRPGSRNHGTAVLGVIGGDENSFGITGISPTANLRAISYWGSSTSQTIIDAADELNAGDILLLEVHRRNPHNNKHIAIEWWPDDFAAIVYATSKGVIVVEAAGNGSQDFDAEIFNTPQSGFPSSWKNPFKPNNPQSGAVIVGAGASPSSGRDRSILGFSNWGRRVDAQGWGHNVTTAGYGGEQGDKFISVDPNDNWNVEEGYPKSLTNNGPGFPGGVGNGADAALWSDTNQKVYIFKGDQYYRLDPGNNWAIDPDYPKPIEDNWPGFPSGFAEGVDAALWSDTNQKIYFFKGNQFIRVDPNNNWNVDPGYPKPITPSWPGFPANFANGVDAAIWSGTNKKIYFFKGSQFIRVDPNNDWKVDSGYPKSITPSWPGFPATFANGVAAALWNKLDQKIYFLKSEDIWYTNSFNGTSSASPVVTGALACIQGRLKARGKSLLTPSKTQDILRTTGSPQMRLSGDPEQDELSNWRGFNARFGSGVDAALWNGKSDRIYFFRGNQYVRVDPNNNWNVDPDYPKPINDNWPGFPSSFTSGVDAALWSETNQKVYFFKNNEYIRVDPNNSWEVDSGYPKPIEGNWPGFPSNFAEGVDGALWSNTNQKIYFFKGNEFIRVDPNNSWNVDSGYPKPITPSWPGFPSDFASGINAALWSGTNNKIYFFRGEEYIRTDPNNSWNVDAGYPKIIARQRIGNRPDVRQAFQSLGIASNWPGFPDSFGENIDAALWSETNNKVYFFKGSQFIRVDPNNGWEVDSGYPKPITPSWPGFPRPFANGVDAALWSEINKKIYFFKGSRFIRVDPNNGWQVDSGYPKTISPSWPGFPTDFAEGVVGALWSGTNQKIYFFKGSQYIRVDPANSWNVDSGYPKSIQGNWPELPSSFNNGIQAALWNGKSQKIYFFKGSEYVRVNPADGWKMENGYPLPIIS